MSRRILFVLALGLCAAFVGLSWWFTGPVNAFEVFLFCAAGAVTGRLSRPRGT